MTEHSDTIYFEPFENDPDSFREMYFRYFSELCKNRPDIVFTNTEYVERYESQKCLLKYFIVSGSTRVGLIILQRIKYKTVSRPYWYIVEFFIEPEYRRRGLGKKAFEHFLRTKQSDFFLHILIDNVAGHAFWDSVIQRNGLHTCDDPTICNYDDTDLYVIHLKE